MPEAQLRRQLSHAGAVGTPVLNVQVAIMDDQGTLLAPGESGEIVYRGPHTMTGYLDDPEATDAAFAHGWLHSGDIGRFDDDGSSGSPTGASTSSRPAKRTWPRSRPIHRPLRLALTAPRQKLYAFGAAISPVRMKTLGLGVGSVFAQGRATADLTPEVRISRPSGHVFMPRRLTCPSVVRPLSMSYWASC